MDGLLFFLMRKMKGGKLPNMSAKVHFSIKYDGPSLASHQMDVRELAPALIALSDLLEHANKAAYPDAGEVRVDVQGNFKGGSFGVDLIAAQTMAQQIVTLLSGSEAAAANLLGILGGLGLIGGGGVIGLIKAFFLSSANKAERAGSQITAQVIGSTQVTEIKYTQGVDLVGLLPQEFKLATTYTLGIASQSSAPELAS
jgi:hypothetical protein